ANPIIWIAISGTRSLADITEFADKTLRPRIQQLPGVGSVRLGGDRERKVRIWLEREKLLAHDLTASDVVQAVVRKN
ncbi:efflux RND transporter permease subunit, partial [Klebsiella pneumoniae]|uniref:efflux RND transporter permease subunit n=1 Tax=Klebsiella pneumoniae TaxID=573 RepID=UPI0013A5A932